MRSVCPISVIIPTYNRHQSLQNTIESLLSGDIIPKEILIIDQSDSIFDTNRIEAPESCHIECFKQEEPSATKARNFGIKSANCEYILFCDDDILVDKITIERLYTKILLEENSLVAGMHYEISGIYSDKHRSVLRDIAGTILGMKKAWRKDSYVIKSTLRGRYTQYQKQEMNTEWAQGYFFCVKRQLVNEMPELFDEKLVRYSYAEDLDFTYRYYLLSKRKGLTAIVDPHLYVNHLATKEWRVRKQEEILYLFANRRYLSYKLFPRKWYYRLLMSLFDYIYALSEIKRPEYFKQILFSLKICSQCKENLRDGQLEILQEVLHG